MEVVHANGGLFRENHGPVFLKTVSWASPRPEAHVIRTAYGSTYDLMTGCMAYVGRLCFAYPGDRLICVLMRLACQEQNLPQKYVQ